MASLSEMSDTELLALRAQASQPQASSLQEMSNDELLALRGQAQAQQEEQRFADQSANIAGKSDLGPEIGTVEDVARSLGRGVRAGTEALVGLPGDIAGAQQSLTGAALDRFGVSERTRDRILNIIQKTSPLSNPLLPTTEEVQSGTNLVLGEPGQAQTTAGEFAETIGEFVPAAAAGPGGLIRKAALAVVPGVASEGAGQLTEGTAAEPAARIAGAFGGGLAAAGRGASSVVSKLDEAPSFQTVKRTTDQLYDGLRNAGIQYNPNAFGRFAKSLTTRLHDKGFRAGVAPKAFSVLNELADKVGDTLDFSDLESIRRTAGNISRGDADKTERSVARQILTSIDNFSSKAPLSNTAGLSPAQVNTAQKEAREFASRKIKAEILSEAIEKAKTAQSGFESGLRNQFSSLLRSKKARSFTAEERKAIQSAAKGDFTNNALGSLGRLGIDFGNLGNRATLLPGLAGGSAAVAGEPVTGALVVGLGTLAKFAARKGTEKAAERAKQTVLSGREAQKQSLNAGQLEKTRAQIRRLLTGEAGLRTSDAPVVELLGNVDG